jgi:hypothetical protein
VSTQRNLPLHEVKADEDAQLQRLALTSAARATDAGEVAVRALRERARKNVAPDEIEKHAPPDEIKHVESAQVVPDLETPT